MGGARKIFNHSAVEPFGEGSGFYPELSRGIERGIFFMKLSKLSSFIVLITVISISLTGCGVSKNKYEALLNEKIALEEKLNLLTKSRDALRSEYENLLKDKMDLASKVETLTNEKSAFKGEYDKLLDEKVSLKAAYDKVSTPKEAQTKAARR